MLPHRQVDVGQLEREGTIQHFTAKRVRAFVHVDRPCQRQVRRKPDVRPVRLREPAAHERSALKATCKSRTSVFDAAEDFGEILLHPGQVHLVDDTGKEPVRHFGGVASDLQHGTGAEVALEISVAQDIRAVGPVRADGDEARRAGRRLGHQRRQLRLARARHAGQDDERLCPRRRHVGGHLPRLVDKPLGLNVGDEVFECGGPVPAGSIVGGGRFVHFGPDVRPVAFGFGLEVGAVGFEHGLQVSGLAGTDEEFEHLFVDLG